MKIIFFLFLGVLTIGNAQDSIDFSRIFTEQTSEEQKFEIYLDTISKYMYRDGNIVQFGIKNCQKILDQNIPIPDSTFFRFTLKKIYYQLYLDNPVGAYQIILEFENKLEEWQISDLDKGNFNYIKAYTYMAMGDLGEAQKTYYQNIEEALMVKDTNNIYGSLYSLGQLYSEQGNHLSAIEYYNKALEIEKHYKISASSISFIHMARGVSLQALKKERQAIDELDIAYKFATESKLRIFKADILLQKGVFYLENGEQEKAEEIYAQILNNKKEFNTEDPKIKFLLDNFLVNLYHSQKKYQQAINVQFKVLEQIDSNNYSQVIEAYDKLQLIHNEMEDYKSAYQHLLTHHQLKKKQDNNLKKLNTEYLKIRFETGEKEKENVLLSAQLVENKQRHKILFLSLAISGLVMLLLFGAFYQKNKYSKKLEVEVSKRTYSLKQTNKELKEFNRILSHDLKEPIRSIVGFSQLATKPNKSPEETKEYLDFVIESGQQLQNLISSISDFQKIDTADLSQIELVDIQKISSNALRKIRTNQSNKEIDLTIKTTCSIYLPKDVFSNVLQKIFDNAARFNKNKLVKIEVDYTLKKNMHYFEIKDNGIGIAPEYHTQIFQMFKRLNNRDTYKGSGLGLSFAKKSIEKMNGTLTLLNSQKEEGSTFLIQIPVFNQQTNSVSKIEAISESVA